MQSRTSTTRKEARRWDDENDEDTPLDIELAKDFNSSQHYSTTTTFAKSLFNTSLLSLLGALGVTIALSTAMLVGDTSTATVPLSLSYLGEVDVSQTLYVRGQVNPSTSATPNPWAKAAYYDVSTTQKAWDDARDQAIASGSGTVPVAYDFTPYSVTSKRIAWVNPTTGALVIATALTVYCALTLTLPKFFRADSASKRALTWDWALESLFTPALTVLVLMLFGVTDIVTLTAQFAASHASIAYLGLNEVTKPMDGGSGGKWSWYIGAFVGLVTNVGLLVYLFSSSALNSLSWMAMGASVSLSIGWVIQALFQGSYFSWLRDPSRKSIVYNAKKSPLANFARYAKLMLGVGMVVKLLALCFAGFAFLEENNTLYQLQSYFTTTDAQTYNLYAACMNTSAPLTLPTGYLSPSSCGPEANSLCLEVPFGNPVPSNALFASSLSQCVHLALDYLVRVPLSINYVAAASTP